MRDELLRRALQELDKLKNNPGYQALMDHQEQMRRNPAYQAIIDETNRRNLDPAHKILMENISTLNQNPAYQALIEFEKNHSRYREITALTQKDYFNDNIYRRISELHSDLLRRNAELWINPNVLKLEVNFKRFEDNLYPSASDKLVHTTENTVLPEKPLTNQLSNAATVVEKINEDYSSIERELSSNERLAMFAVVGKNEYKIKNLIAEERNNRIKVFLDSGDDGLIIFFSPFDLQVLFRKEKNISVEAQERVNFLSYKRSAEGKDEVRILTNKQKNEVKQLSIIRVVVASPSDVLPERNALAEVIDDINSGVDRALGIHLQLGRWETDAYPGFHLDGAQGLIDPILAIEDADIFIGIFWKRFGTPTMTVNSGTEYEFLKAYESWQNNGAPHIMFYFNQQPYFPSTPEETQQWGQVLEFKRNFPKEELFWQYDSEARFEKSVRRHLTNFLIDNSFLDKDSNEDSIESSE